MPLSRIARELVVLLAAAATLPGPSEVGAQEPPTPPPTPPSRPAPTRPAPLRPPTLPRRPGFTVPSRPGLSRPQGSDREPAAIKAAKYALEVTGSKHVVGVYRCEVYTTRTPAAQWEALFPATMELSRQTSTGASMEPAFEVMHELSRAQRPYLRARLPVAGSEAPQTVALTVRYEATLLARRLVPVKPGERVEAVAGLDFRARSSALVANHALDFQSARFQAWLDRHQFRRQAHEDEIDFARRVYQGMVSLYGYRDGIEIAPVSTLCDESTLDCDTLSLVFVGAMRSAVIPARVVHGWPCRPLRHAPDHRLSGHAQAEFFAEGVGWVPVDLVHGIIERERDPMKYFAADDGDLLVVQIDPDYIVRHADQSSERIISLHPGPSVWAHGKGVKPDVTIRPISWDVEIEPGS